MQVDSYINLMSNVFPHEVCDLLMAEYEKNLDSVPPRKHFSSGCPEPMAVFSQDILDIVDPILEVYVQSYLADKIGEDHEDYLLDSVSILKYGPGDGYKLHPDNPFTITDPAAGTGKYFPLQMIAYLNDDFNGGELEFPNYGWKVKPKKGDIVIFPTGFAFPHKVSEVDANRYILLCAVLKVGKDFVDEE